MNFSNSHEATRIYHIKSWLKIKLVIYAAKWDMGRYFFSRRTVKWITYNNGKRHMAQKGLGCFLSLLSLYLIESPRFPKVHSRFVSLKFGESSKYLFPNFRAWVWVTQEQIKQVSSILIEGQFRLAIPHNLSMILFFLHRIQLISLQRHWSLLAIR